MRTLFILFSAICMISLSSCATRVATKRTSITIVKKAPKHHKIVVVKGKRYYFWNGKHYRKTRRGFIVTRV